MFQQSRIVLQSIFAWRISQVSERLKKIMMRNIIKFIALLCIVFMAAGWMNSFNYNHVPGNIYHRSLSSSSGNSHSGRYYAPMGFKKCCMCGKSEYVNLNDGRHYCADCIKSPEFQQKIKCVFALLFLVPICGFCLFMCNS